MMWGLNLGSWSPNQCAILWLKSVSWEISPHCNNDSRMKRATKEWICPETVLEGPATKRYPVFQKCLGLLVAGTGALSTGVVECIFAYSGSGQGLEIKALMLGLIRDGDHPIFWNFISLRWRWRGADIGSYKEEFSIDVMVKFGDPLSTHSKQLIRNYGNSYIKAWIVPVAQEKKPIKVSW